MALLSMRARKFYQRTRRKIIIDGSNTAGYDKSKVKCFNYHKMGHFARECRAPRSKDNRNWNQGSSSKAVKIEDASEKVMCAIDGAGFHWSDMAEEEIQANIALMAFSDSEVTNDKSCSKSCLKNYEALKKQYDDLLVKLDDTGFKAATYKRGLTTLEDQIIKYREHEVLFSEEIALLKRSVGSKEYQLGLLRTELEKVKQEKERVDFKIAKFDKSAKDLDQLPNKLDLSYSGLDEFKEPEFKGYGPENSKKESNVVCENYSNETKKNFDAPLIEEWVSDDEDEDESPVVVKKKTVIPTVAKIEKPVRKPLGNEFVMNNKACFACGSFNHLIKDCKRKVQKPIWNNARRVNHHNSHRMSYPHPKRNFVPKAVLMKTGMRPVNAAKPKAAYNAVKRNSWMATEDVKSVRRLGTMKEDDLRIKQRCWRKSFKEVKITGNGFNTVYYVSMRRTGFFCLSDYILLGAGSGPSGERMGDVVGRLTLHLCLLCMSSKDAIANDAGKKTNEEPANDGERNGQEKEGGASNKEDDQNVQDFRVELDNLLVQQKEGYANSTNRVSTISPSVSVAGGAYDDEDEGAEADLNNLETTMNVSPIPTTRIHKDHPKEQIIGDLFSAPQTRRMTKSAQEHAMAKPKKVTQDLRDPSWIEAMQDELLQFRLQKKQGKTGGTRYTQEEGINYDEVFAPVARIETIRLFLAYASFMGFIVYQMDVKSAFLYGIIKEEVYVCQPPGFEDPQFPDKVYKVEKEVGTHTLSTYLLENGYRRGTIDKTLFIKKDRGDILLVQVYVNDIIFRSTKKSLCVEFKQTMHKRSQMSSMGELTFFLGLQVQQKEDGIFISQDKYVADILKKFDFVTVKTASAPMEPNKALVKDEEADNVDVHLYRLMIRSLMCLTASRPDITFVVCACASFQVTPKVSHLHDVKRIFKYLKGQPKL
ncbi:putative ribonuclease H-like domain-containing protein, partial [Tanacetum coccineum]